MSTYHLQEAELELPNAWQDNTINTFVLAGPKGRGNVANVVITRDHQTDSDEVDHYADLQLVEAAKGLQGYKLRWRRALELDGQSALEVSYTWRTPERIEIEQRQAYVRWGGHFLIFTLTTKRQDMDAHEAAWRALLVSVRLRPHGRPSPPLMSEERTVRLPDNEA